MKYRFLLVGFIISFAVGYSQEAKYELQNTISYYHDSINESDQYIKERCVLDLYYPKEIDSFATIIWFHGGGLKAGEKEIPKALMEKGQAVIGVNYRLYPKVKAPVYIEDAAAAVAWTFKNIESFGGNQMPYSYLVIRLVVTSPVWLA